MKALTPALLLLLGACATEASASLDRRSMTSLYPRGDVFTFVAQADAMYPEADAWSEKVRLDWLNAALTEAALRPRGHRVLERHATLLRKGPVGDLHTVRYEGACVAAPV